MNHTFDVVTIHITGLCKACGQFVDVRRPLSSEALYRFRGSPAELRAFELERAWEQLEEHKCEPAEVSE